MKTLSQRINEVFIFATGLFLIVSAILLLNFYNFEKEQATSKIVGKITQLFNAQLPLISDDIHNGNLEVLKIRSEILASSYRNVDLLLVIESENQILFKTNNMPIFKNSPTEFFKPAVFDSGHLTIRFPVLLGEKELATVLIGIMSPSPLQTFIKKSFALLALVSILVLLAILLFVRWWVASTMKKQFAELALAVNYYQGANEAVPSQKFKFVFKEFFEIGQNLELEHRERVDAIKKKHSLEIAFQKQEALTQVTRQVAHDIRSPLTAIDMIFKTLWTDIVEEKRILIRQSLGRIRDIANNLLIQSANQQLETPIQARASNFAQNNEPLSKELLFVLIDSLVSEKRIQYRPHLGVEIDLAIEPEAVIAFSEIVPSHFKRILSNLINNSVEALSNNKGKILVKVTAPQANFITISIVDNGKGIPADVLPRLGEQGASFGKNSHPESGSGLGLFHAKSIVEAWGGSFSIQSTAGEGTTISFNLKLVSEPDWFIGEIKISNYSNIVILDDDPSIHGIWKERFEKIRPQLPDLKVHHFSNPEDVKLFIRDQLNTGTQNKYDIQYLFDFELIGHKESGLDIIEELKIHKNAILVTSHFEDSAIRARCARLNMRQLPKAMAPFVKLTVLEEKEKFDFVLIDDDDLIRQVWTVSARSNNKKMCVFKDVESFLAKTSMIDIQTPIYIDSNLEGGVKGEIEAKRIFDLGFSEIHICTGYAPESFQKVSYIRSIRGKDPPFL